MLRNLISNSSDSADSNINMEQVSATPSIEGLMWRPSDVQNHQMTKLREKINAKFNVDLEDYPQFHKWSCENYDQFWRQVWKFCDIVNISTDIVHRYCAEDHVIDKSVPIEKVPKWFQGVQLNYAENILRYVSKQSMIFDVERSTFFF